MKRSVLLLLLIALNADAAETRPGWLGLGITIHRAAEEQWLVVALVAPNGPADVAGFSVRDMITAVDGRKLVFRNDYELLQFLGTLRPGQRVKFDVTRGQRQITINATTIVMPEVAYERWKLNLERAKAKLERGKS